MELSDLARRLLRLHAERPDYLFFGVNVLPSMYRDADVDRVEAAYRELDAYGLLEKSSVVKTFFGVPRTLHQISSKGLCKFGRSRPHESSCKLSCRCL